MACASADGQQPEVHRNRDHATHDHQGHAAEALRIGRCFADALQLGAAKPEPQQAEQHADAGGDEDDLVGRQLGAAAEHALSQPAGQDRRDEGAEVDAHVEDREARIATRVAGGVELAHHGRDDRLEQSVAHDDRGEAQLEHGLAGRHDQEQARGHEGCADQDGSLVADQLVGDVAAEDGRGIDQGQVGAVQLAGRGLTLGVAAVELGHDVQHQRPAHAVEGEALPELRHEEHPQGAWMSHELGIFGWRFGAGWCGHSIPLWAWRACFERTRSACGSRQRTQAAAQLLRSDRPMSNLREEGSGLAGLSALA